MGIAGSGMARKGGKAATRILRASAPLGFYRSRNLEQSDYVFLKCRGAEIASTQELRLATFDIEAGTLVLAKQTNQ